MATEVDSRITAVLALYDAQGKTEYFGEKVTKTDHMVQAAQSAEAEGESERVVLACLLHDIGHLLERDDMNGLGVRDHARVGAEYLRSMGMDKLVCDLVEHHAEAKRYLVATRAGYLGHLSRASRRTLLYQGGRMSRVECERFEGLPCFRGAVQVRLHDDRAKETDLPTRNVASYVPLIRKFLSPSVPLPLGPRAARALAETAPSRTQLPQETSS